MTNRSKFITIDTKTLHELLKQDNNKIIYIGRPTCPGCVFMEPILHSVLEEENIKAYYYNTKTAREEELEEFEDMIENIDAHYIPLILYYEGSKEADRLDYYDFAESQDSISEFVKLHMLGVSNEIFL